MNRRGLGSIRRLPSGSWQARYWVGKRRVERSFRLRTDASDWLKLQLARKVGQDTGNPRGTRPNVTIAELSGEWLDDCRRRGLTRNTIAGYRGTVAAVCITNGQRRIKDITPTVLREIASELRGAASTRRNRLNVITAIARYAMQMEYVPYRQLLVRRPAVPLPSTPQVYSDQQVEALIASATALSPRHRMAVLLAVDAGLRLGEILRFQKSDIRRGVVLVPVRDEQDQPKNRKGRKIPIPDRLWECAKSIKQTSNDRLISSSKWTTTPPLLRWLRPVWLGAKIHGETHMHWLRHYWASRLANAPTPATPYELMSWGGWSSLQMVMRYYHAPDHPRRGPVDSLH